MSDFTTLKSQLNTASSTPDATPTWTDMLLSTANYEMRFCAAGAGGAAIASAAWPSFLRPAVTQVIPEMWGYFGADASGGVKCAAYDGTTAHYMQWRVSWDALGTFASPWILSAYKDNTYPAASPGTQPTPAAGGDGSSMINGSADTSNSSYIKANAYGRGTAASGSTQDTPSANAAGTLAVTTGTAGAVSPPITPAWLATWQSLQAATQWITGAVTCQALFAGFLYVVLSLWTGPNITGGTLVPVLTFSYTWV